MFFGVGSEPGADWREAGSMDSRPQGREPTALAACALLARGQPQIPRLSPPVTRTWVTTNTIVHSRSNRYLQRPFAARRLTNSLSEPKNSELLRRQQGPFQEKRAKHEINVNSPTS